jgi:hypothetical protein
LSLLRDKRRRRDLLDAAVLLLAPVLLGVGLLLGIGWYFLDKEISARVADRVAVTQRLSEVDRIQCERTKDNRDGLVKILKRVRDTPRTDPAEVAAAKDFYRRAVADLPPVVCPPAPGND